MYKDKFILSVIHDGRPVKETGSSYKREVAVPFDSEYQLRLKNKNDKACTARVFIDGKKVSQLGDFVIQAGSFVDLERFVDRSLSEGKKFKFVTLDHPDVDDPSSSENGLIEVEFRLAKEKPITITWTDPPFSGGRNPWFPPSRPYWDHGDSGNTWKYYNDNVTFTAGTTNDEVKTIGTVSACYCSSLGDSVRGMKSFVDAGATVEGGHSSQNFSYTSLEVEDTPAAVLKLKIVGLRKSERLTKADVKYCSRCGRRIEYKDKYCSGCGHRL